MFFFLEFIGVLFVTIEMASSKGKKEEKRKGDERHGLVDIRRTTAGAMRMPQRTAPRGAAVFLIRSESQSIPQRTRVHSLRDAMRCDVSITSAEVHCTLVSLPIR